MAQTGNLIHAINHSLDYEMERDDSVVVLGEDVGKFGGVFRATMDLQEKYGENRVIDTPLAEGGIVGSAIGMALNGLTPVAEIQFVDFIYPAFDQIVTELAKMRYRSGGEFTCPMVVRAPYGGGVGGGLYHSQSPEAYFMHTPGLKVVMPSTTSDMKGLLLSSIRDPDPVIFLEPKRLYRQEEGDIPEGDHTVPLGKAQCVQEGRDVSLLAWGAMMAETREAAEQLKNEDGIEVDLLDLRTLLPLDEKTILSSLKKTGRAVIVHEAPKTAGPGAELSALMAEKAVLHLAAPIKRVTGYDTPFPFKHEDEYLPTVDRICSAVREVVDF